MILFLFLLFLFILFRNVLGIVFTMYSKRANLNNEVAAIKRCQPPTITLPNNSMTAVPSIWANAVADNLVDRI